MITLKEFVMQQIIEECLQYSDLPLETLKRYAESKAAHMTEEELLEYLR